MRLRPLDDDDGNDDDANIWLKNLHIFSPLLLLLFVLFYDAPVFVFLKTESLFLKKEELENDPAAIFTVDKKGVVSVCQGIISISLSLALLSLPLAAPDEE